jgi:telomere length regulation protein
MAKSPSECSFPAVVLPIIRARAKALSEQDRDVYFQNWQGVFATLPTSIFAKILASFFYNVTDLPDGLDSSKDSRGLIKRESFLLSRIFGSLGDEEDEKWDAIVLTLLMSNRLVSRARILVCWVTISDEYGTFIIYLEFSVNLTRYLISCSTEGVRHAFVKDC